MGLCTLGWLCLTSTALQHPLCVLRLGMFLLLPGTPSSCPPLSHVKDKLLVSASQACPSCSAS